MGAASSKRDPASAWSCEHGDDGGKCVNQGRQFHKGKPICGMHVQRLRRNGRVGPAGSEMLRSRVRKPQRPDDAALKREKKEREAARKLSLTIKATGWTPRLIIFNHASGPTGHWRKLYSSDGASRVSRMIIASWVARGWAEREHEHLLLTREGAAAAAKWK